MTRIVRGLSVFWESFSKCTFSFPYVLFLTSFAFYHINQVRRFARHLLFDFSYFPSVVKCVVCSFIINVWASETSMFRVAARKCQKNGWVGWWFLGSEVSREPIAISHEDLVNVGKLQQVLL